MGRAVQTLGEAMRWRQAVPPRGRAPVDARYLPFPEDPTAGLLAASPQNRNVPRASAGAHLGRDSALARCESGRGGRAPRPRASHGARRLASECVPDARLGVDSDQDGDARARGREGAARREVSRGE